MWIVGFAKFIRFTLSDTFHKQGCMEDTVAPTLVWHKLDLERKSETEIKKNGTRIGWNMKLNEPTNMECVIQHPFAKKDCQHRIHWTTGRNWLRTLGSNLNLMKILYYSIRMIWLQVRLIDYTNEKMILKILKYDWWSIHINLNYSFIKVVQ